MKVEELLDLCSQKKLIIYKGQVFFNEWDEAEVGRFQKLGCIAVPWYSLEEVEWRKKRGYPCRGWEVHLIGACDRIWEEEDGDEVDITAAVLLSSARDRVFA